MPKVNMLCDVDLSDAYVRIIGEATRRLVATAASTKSKTFNPETAIDFYYIPNAVGSLVDGVVSFEIETAATQERVEKLTAEVVTQLRDDLVTLLRKIPAFGEDFNPRQLVWIKYQDPRGPHV